MNSGGFHERAGFMSIGNGTGGHKMRKAYQASGSTSPYSH